MLNPENHPRSYEKGRRVSRPILGAGLIALLFLAWLALPLPRAARPIQAQVTSGITFPAAGLTVSGVVTVLGTATIGDFQRYELYYKPSAADDSAYTYFADGVEEVFDGPLGLWDTNDLPADEYTLRLRVVRNDANYMEYFTSQVYVNPSAPPTPLPTPVFPTPGVVPLVTPPAQPTLASPIEVARPISGTVARTITMLGRGTASAPPDRALVRLFLTSAGSSPATGYRPLSEADLQSVVATLQAAGAPPEETRMIPFSRLPDGSSAASEVRFTYRQPAALSTFLATALGQLANNPAVQVADMSVRFGVATCAPLEEEALRAAILAARARAEPMATVLNVRLGPVLSVSENVAAVPVTGSCLDLLDDTAFMPLSGDTPTSVEVAVTLAVTFVISEVSGLAVPEATPTTFTTLPTPIPTIVVDLPTTPAPAPVMMTHVVVFGETIYNIAASYGVSVEAIMAANNLTPEAAQALQQGQVLNIPTP